MSTITTPVLPALQQKFLDVRHSMLDRSVERGEIIETGLLGLSGRLHSFYYGSPGIAKSFIVEQLLGHVEDDDDDEYFRILMTAWTTDSELFGDRDLAAMDRNERKRVLDHTLVKARVAFIDEVYKANSSALNAMLTILNEGVFDNGTDGTVHSPLHTVFSASNEFARGDELAALSDRLHFWHVVKPIQEDANFIRMLKLQDLPDPTPMLTFEDIDQAQSEVRQIPIDEEVYEALNQLRNDLRGEGVEPTDRRFALTLRCIQANAWMTGQSEAHVEDMTPIRFMLWNRLDQISTVDKLVLNLSSELEAEAKELEELADELGAAVQKCLDADNDRAKNNLAMEVHNNLKNFSSDVTTLAQKVKASGRPSNSVDRLVQRADSMMVRIVRDGFGIDPDTGKPLGL